MRLLSCGSLQTVTEVSNILAWCKYSILKEFDALPLLETSIDNGAEENGVLWLNDVFANVSLDDMICADANITYYVSGYVGKSISFCCKCSFCKELLITGDDFFSIHHYLPDEYKQFLKT